MTYRGDEMHKRTFKGTGRVMGRFFRPFVRCCEKDGHRDEGEKKKCGRGCGLVSRRKKDDDIEKTEKESSGSGLRLKVITNVLKYMFDASDIDYDYED